jgi:hypothetical protein
VNDELRNDLIDELVAASQEAAGGCCLAPEWRQHLCEYHQGYEQGAEAALLAIEGAAEDLEEGS